MDKKKISLIVAIVMGVAAMILVNKYIRQFEKEKASKTDTQQIARVLIATKQIPAGTSIDKTMLAFQDIPLQFVQPGALNSAEAALGKRVVVDIAANEQILSSKFSDTVSRGQGSTLAMKTPFGKRAITISVDQLSAVGGMLRPGDYVDILGNFPFPQIINGKAEMQIATVMLFQNVLILAVGTQFEREEDSSGPAPPRAPTITLALSPREAELITYAQQQGQLKLILRSPLDSTIELVPITSTDTLLQYIFSQQGIDLTTIQEQQEDLGLQPENKEVEIYRGGKRE
ncbi:MAG: Flp pilus assembly protein CpaB [Candidatus Omnitrophota bacterium]